MQFASITIESCKVLLFFKQMKIKQDREGKSFQATDQHAELVELEGPDADKQIGGNS